MSVTMPDHPAKFAPSVLRVIERLLPMYVKPNARLLDPFAGVGGVHSLTDYRTVGVELEPEWALQHPKNEVGDALKLRFRAKSFDAIVTSPCYGNRMADHHDARDGSRRHTYKHKLGRDLSEGSAATLQWGHDYRVFHRVAIAEWTRVARSHVVLNMSDHWREGVVQPVTAWWISALTESGWKWLDAEAVLTPRNRDGENGAMRMGNEWVLVFERTDV